MEEQVAGLGPLVVPARLAQLPTSSTSESKRAKLDEFTTNIYAKYLVKTPKGDWVKKLKIIFIRLFCFYKRLLHCKAYTFVYISS